MVWVNNWLIRDLSTPFGGVKHSGVGREGGKYSLEFYSETKNVYIHLPRPTPSGATNQLIVTPAVVPAATLPSVSVAPPAAPAPAPSATSSNSGGVIDVSAAPKPVGAYPHARQHGNLLFLSGIGPRTPGTNAIPGGPIRDADKNPLEYDVAAQTHQVITNIKIILEGCGATLKDIIDVQVFLIDMDRDFSAFNKVYGEYFKDIQATRTTIAINALPTPIAVEFKVIAKVPGSS
jgi:2-aminomuconate deaminase